MSDDEQKRQGRPEKAFNRVCMRPECATAHGCYYKGKHGECSFPAGGSIDRWPITPWR